ncbi:lipopolysaccharide biosynthesis protein [Agromyces intestinalis]|uniref:Lipopolysaccharide biosynthesis protein n=1 Tax=Agromyces intestinalis TaxID=2592652 RepID=A0A5C1YDL3_9MICO|nr:lipopolysaccharide biosynthesis protein [Agromyces intestinalis]QEO14166.1 lipopolysaccharide biosynthesis protein [Agromyces intestinalis]
MAIDERPPSLGASASRGAAVTLGAQLVRVLVQLAGIVVLARLLTPADYGVLAMVLAIIGVGEVFRDFGLSAAAVQAREVTHAQRTNLFWINTGIGALLAVAVCAASGPIAAFYGDPRLQPVAIALSATFLLNGLATQFRADLNRRMRFMRLSSAEIAGQIAGLVVGVWLALGGAGYGALVAQQLVVAAATLVALVAVTGWWPGLPSRGVPMRGFLRFGGNLVASQLVAYASRNVDSVVIGATVGASALGLYNRAFQLMLMPLNQVNAPSTRVALPVLSRLQDSPARYAEFIGLGQAFMLNLVGAILAFGCAQAGPLIDLALGAQWEPAVPIFRILAVAGFFQAAGYATYWVFLSKGLTGAHLAYTLATRPVMIGLIVLGSFWGVLGVAAVFAIATAVLWPIALWWAGRVSDAPVGMLWRNGVRAFAVHATAGAASFAATAWLPDAAWALRLAVGALAFAGALGVAALALRPFRDDVRRMVAIRRYFRAGGAQPDPGEAG